MKTLSLLLALVTCAPVYAASFDCKKAASFAEKEICSDALLGKLDEAMAQNYNAMRSSNIGSGALKDLKATQREWISVRNKCTDKSCLVASYRKRVDEVCEYPVLSGVHPGCVSSDDIK